VKTTANTLLLLGMILLAGCAGGVKTFGEPVSSATPVPVTDLLAGADQFDGKTLVVEGTVAEVCQNKGCWMTLVSGDREMRVRFKDYGFFVPKNSSGRKARLEGVFTKEMVPVEEARHYLEDAGKHAEAEKITEPVPSYTFMASGVQLSK